MNRNRDQQAKRNGRDPSKIVDRRRFLKSSVASVAGAGTLLALTGGSAHVSSAARAAESDGPVARAVYPTLHKSVAVDGLEIFYREAGPKDAPTILLLHGFPTSSQMFRNLIPALSDRFHVVAPDYPGFGNSASPHVSEFPYTFNSLTDVVDKFVEVLGIGKFSIYMMDYGGPVGFRLAVRHPERVETLIVQNANAYDEGLRDFWHPFKVYWEDRSEQNAAPLKGFLKEEATRWQWIHGTRNEEAISPDTWTVDQYHLDRPGNAEIQLRLFYDYGSNPPLYPEWQAYFRKHQPPTLIVWGKNDQIFPAEGAHPYRRDLDTVEFHLLDTGHFALEEEGDFIATRIRAFIDAHLT